MKLNGTPDGSTQDSEEETDILEDDLVILEDDQAEQFLEQLQQSNGAAVAAEEGNENDMECDETEADDIAAEDQPDDAVLVLRSHTGELFVEVTHYLCVISNDKSQKMIDFD